MHTWGSSANSVGRPLRFRAFFGSGTAVRPIESPSRPLLLGSGTFVFPFIRPNNYVGFRTIALALKNTEYYGERKRRVDNEKLVLVPHPDKCVNEITTQPT